MYSEVTENVNYIYGRNGGGRTREFTIARLRLGYKYPLECNIPMEDSLKMCSVCGERLGHNLKHYVMECQYTEPFRKGVREMIPMTKLMINVIDNILRIHKQFACVE